ncbi:MAG: hypothetical protein WA191_07285 [Telluria sp.]|nr:hypothetical protein [Telluria sp.]
MNIAKNMDAIFLVALGLVSVTTLATAAAPAARIVPPFVARSVQAAPAAGMPVVTITAKRLTAAEKAALDS